MSLFLSLIFIQNPENYEEGDEDEDEDKDEDESGKSWVTYINWNFKKSSLYQ